MTFDPALKRTKHVFERNHCEPQPKIAKNIILVLLTFFVVVFVGQMAELVPLAIITGDPEQLASITSKLPGLFATALRSAVVLAFCLGVERRKPRSMGFTTKRLIPNYLLGLLLGFATFSTAILIAMLGGGYRFDGFDDNIAWGTLLLFLLAWGFQGFGEELMCRSYLLCDIGTHHSPWTAVLLSSLAFMALHFGNPNTSVLAFINLALFGVEAALLFLRTDNIWLVSALHTMWNCAQGNIYGVQVSGMDVENTIMHFVPIDGHVLFSGGAFGIEGGLGDTIISLIVIFICLFDFSKKQPDAEA